MTSATERLRALLDERGVEWEPVDGYAATYVEHNGEAWRFDYDEPFDQLGIVCLSGYTPEQAVDTTLGPGTCRDEGDPSDFCCSECGVRMFTNTSDTYTMIAADEHTIIKHPNFCPNCGRKVVE